MARLLKNAVEADCGRFGLTPVANWRLAKQPQEQYLRRLVDAFGIDLILDVGANAGQ